MRTSLMAALLLAGAIAPFASQAKYPDHPIRLIVASAAGGGNDFVARAMSQKVAGKLGQPLVIENKGGAAGLVATSYVANANPDGYTVLLVFANYATFPSLASKSGFDPQKSLAPVSNIASTPLVLLVPKSLPADSIKTLIQYADQQTHAGKSLDFASSGVGSMGHMAAELFAGMAHVQMNHIPYKGGGPAVMALLGNQVQMYFSTPAAAMTQVSSGRLRALGVTSARRAPFAPDIPSIAEAGLPGYEVNGWFGLFVPAATPKSVVDTLYRAFSSVARDKEIEKEFAKEGISPIGSTPAEFSRQVATDVAKWRPIMQRLSQAGPPQGKH